MALALALHGAGAEMALRCHWGDTGTGMALTLGRHCGGTGMALRLGRYSDGTGGVLALGWHGGRTRTRVTLGLGRHRPCTELGGHWECPGTARGWCCPGPRTGRGAAWHWSVWGGHCRGQQGTGTSTELGPAPQRDQHRTRVMVPPRPAVVLPVLEGGWGDPPGPRRVPRPRCHVAGRGLELVTRVTAPPPPPRPPPPAVSHGPAMLREVGGLPSASQCLPVSLCSPLLYPCSPPVVPLLLALLPVQPPQNHHGSPSTDPPVQPPRPVQLPLVQQHPTQYSTHPSTTRSQYSPPQYSTHPSTAPPVHPLSFPLQLPRDPQICPSLGREGRGSQQSGGPHGVEGPSGSVAPNRGHVPSPVGGPRAGPIPPSSPHPHPFLR